MRQILPRMTDATLALLYQDDWLLIVDKPAGLLSVPGRGEDKQDCLIARAQQHFPDALTVHRLDMATSGLIVFARGAEMQRKLSILFQDREVDKRYEALVSGCPSPAAGEIDLPLICDWPNRPKQKVDHEIGKPSLTRYQVHNTFGEYTRIELEPYTGRSHQLRVHLCAIGHPIVGDALYGGAAAERLMLHACRLGFTHPHSGTALNFASPPPF
jgi:tRNA pseudouridine32 synthase/23S rRNA pseudouridine746 synthase